MTIKQFVAIVAIAVVGILSGVSSTLAETNATRIGIIAVDPVENLLPKPLSGESQRPTALVVQADEFVFCTADTDILPVWHNVGVFVQETDEVKLCIPIEAMPLEQYGNPVLLSDYDL